MIKKKELIVVSVLIFLSVIGIVGFRCVSKFKNDDLCVVATQNDRIILEVPLSEDYERKIISSEGENVLVIKNHKASIISADCLNQICVHSPQICQIGETICCLPHHLIIEIKNK